METLGETWWLFTASSSSLSCKGKMGAAPLSPMAALSDSYVMLWAHALLQKVVHIAKKKHTRSCRHCTSLLGLPPQAGEVQAQHMAACHTSACPFCTTIYIYICKKLCNHAKHNLFKALHASSFMQTCTTSVSTKLCHTYRYR